MSTELVIRSEGVDRVSDGKYTGWISVEVTAHWNTGGLASRVIFGRPRTTEQDARDRKSTRLNSSHITRSRMTSSA